MQVIYKYKEVKKIFKLDAYVKLPHSDLICINKNNPVKYIIGWPFVASNIMKD